MSDQRITGRRTWTLRSKTDIAPPKTSKGTVEWSQETRGWAPTAWRRKG